MQKAYSQSFSQSLEKLWLIEINAALWSASLTCRKALDESCDGWLLFGICVQAINGQTAGEAEVFLTSYLQIKDKDN